MFSTCILVFNLAFVWDSEFPIFAIVSLIHLSQGLVLEDYGFDFEFGHLNDAVALKCILSDQR